MTRPQQYYAKPISRCTWHVIGPSGYPVYDGAPYGNDKPLIFHDEEKALEYVERCNLNAESGEN